MLCHVRCRNTKPLLQDQANTIKRHGQNNDVPNSNILDNNDIENRTPTRKRSMPEQPLHNVCSACPKPNNEMHSTQIKRWRYDERRSKQIFFRYKRHALYENTKTFWTAQMIILDNTYMCRYGTPLIELI